MATESKSFSGYGTTLVGIQLFRLLFGGYLIGLDQFHYTDLESAYSVLFIYVLIGIFTTLYLLGRRKSGLLGLIALSVILLIMQSLYIFIYFSAPTPDPSWHNPLLQLWATVANFLFPLLTLVLAVAIYKES
ncbi:MAG: hypothetical protein ACFFE6_11930 [Candidatus Thorarchaeota archaeon]